MEKEPLVVTREELYELVWSEPMHALAPWFGISDVGLAKICRKMNIPLPGRGYWAKKSANSPVPARTPLPVLPPNSSMVPRSLGFRAAPLINA